jgi:hypothetical protein
VRFIKPDVLDDARGRHRVLARCIRSADTLLRPGAAELQASPAGGNGLEPSASSSSEPACAPAAAGASAPEALKRFFAPCSIGSRRKAICCLTPRKSRRRRLWRGLGRGAYRTFFTSTIVLVLRAGEISK